MVAKRLCSSIVAISDLRKCRREGYTIHQTSLDGSSFAAEAMKAAAPG